MTSNKARVGRALYLLKMDLDAFVPREFRNYHREEAADAVNQILGQSRDAQRPFHNMKAQDLLTVVQSSWWDIFDRALGGIEPSLVREVSMAHEAWANRQDFAPDHAFQVLNSIQRLLAAMSSPSTLELDMLKRESLESEVEAEEGVEPGSLNQFTQPEVAVPPANPEPVVEEFPAEEAETEEPVETLRPDTEGEPFLQELLRVLREAGALQPQDFISRATRESVPPEFADDSFFQDLAPALAQSLGDCGIHSLLAHQGTVVSQTLSGANLALSADWAVDETPTWGVALAELLLRNPGSHALVLLPERQKAASALARLTTLLSATELGVVAGPDDPASAEAPAAGPHPSKVLITAIDELNQSLSNQAVGWQAFLKDTRLVVIDQAQEYQGQFGAHAAILLRRLAHRLAVLGANPQTIVVAQGCGNAPDLAETLTGIVFQTVSAPDGPAPKRHYLFVDPREAGPEANSDLADRICRAALTCARWGKSVLLCFPSGNRARQNFLLTRELLDPGEQDVEISLLLDRDSPTGAVGDENVPAGRCIFTTGSRATGILPGDFDGVILAGYPGYLRELWQLMEAAGKGIEEEAFVLFISDGQPESRFVAHSLDSLLARASDQVVSDPDMADIIRTHLPALYRESAGRIYSFSPEVLGNAVFQAIRRDTSGLTSPEELPPQFNMKPGGEDNWALWHEGEQIGSLSPYGRFREAYPGSVIVVDGAKYRPAFSETGEDGDGSPQIVLESSEALAHLRTIPYFETSVSIQQDSLCLSPAAGVSFHLGMLSVEERLDQVSVIDESEWVAAIDEAASPTGGGNMVTATFTPEQESLWSHNSPAFWLDVSGFLAEDPEGGEEVRAKPALAAVEQMLRLGARFTFPVDGYDLATYSDATTVYLVEVSPRAQGIAKRAFDLWRDLLEFGANLARQCPCNSGCLHCLLPHFPYDRELDKAEGLKLADRLLEATQGS